MLSGKWFGVINPYKHRVPYSSVHKSVCIVKDFLSQMVFQEIARFRCCPLPLHSGKAIVCWHAVILLLSCPAWDLWSWQNIMPDLCRLPQPSASNSSRVSLVLLLGLKQASLQFKLELEVCLRDKKCHLKIQTYFHLVDIKQV